MKSEVWTDGKWKIVLEPRDYKEVPMLFTEERQASLLLDNVPRKVAKKFWEYVLACDHEIREECVNCPGP